MSILDLTPINQTLLVIDPSASHLAYCYVDIDHDKKEAHFKAAGMLWTKGTWNRGQRYSYMNKCFKSMITGVTNYVPNVVVTESFFMNPNQLSSGTPVIPTVNGLIEMNCAEVKNVIYTEVPTSSWRPKLGIKFKLDKDSKRDYKVPTLDAVENAGIKVDNEVLSNITGKLRETPYDVSDALAIAIAVCRHNNVNSITVSNTLFYSKSLNDEFNKLSKEV